METFITICDLLRQMDIDQELKVYYINPDDDTKERHYIITGSMRDYAPEEWYKDTPSYAMIEQACEDFYAEPVKRITVDDDGVLEIELNVLPF